MSIQGIIFDHDGTLVDSEGVHYDLWRYVLARYGIDFPLQEYLDHHAGVPTRTNAEVICQTHQLGISAEELLAENHVELHRWLADNAFPLRPGARQALDACVERKLAIGLASGAARLEIDHSLNHHQLQSYFHTTVSKDDVSHAKPHPETYALCAQRLGLEPGDCVAIEDSATGLQAAKAAGLRCITVAYEYSSSHDLSAADGHADNLESALAMALSL